MPARKLSIVGVALIASAVLIFGMASLYVSLAPKTYSAKVMLRITPRSAAVSPGQIEVEMGKAFEHDHAVMITFPRGSSLFEVVAFDRDPDGAAQLAEQKAFELIKILDARLETAISKVSSASRGRPVRPKVKSILVTAGITSLNLAIAGFICLFVGFWKVNPPLAVAANA